MAVAEALPEVIEALKEMMTDSECYCLDADEMAGKPPCAYCQLRAALAKIEGTK